jgi:hypothetical protein
VVLIVSPGAAFWRNLRQALTRRCLQSGEKVVSA